MVSGFLISPNDHERIFSGLEREIRIWSKVGAATTGLKMFRISWFIRDSNSTKRKRSAGVPPAEKGAGETPALRHHQLFSSSTLRPSERISLTSTLKLSGIPASNASSPRTIDS